MKKQKTTGTLSEGFSLIHVAFCAVGFCKIMADDTQLLFSLKKNYLEFSLPSTILIIIAAVIGVVGNTSIIVIYFFRIKERGERYFIPLLAVVDLLACFTIAPFYVIGNIHFYDYPSDNICRVLSFFHFLVTGISAHVLLVISVQRYLLVCKPFGPKMTLFWKRVSFGIFCVFGLAYSAPVLKTSGVRLSHTLYRNQTVTTRICRFSVDRSPGIVAYFASLVLISVISIILTAAFYAPVLTKLRISIGTMKKSFTLYKEDSTGSSPYSVCSPSLSTSNCAESGHEHPELERGDNAVDTTTSELKNKEPLVEHHTDSRVSTIKRRLQSERLQKRISIMFFIIILTYVLSYIPPLIVLILTYTIKDFNYLTLTRGQTIIWIYVPRLLFVNHIMNPLIYGYFDAKYREKLMECFRR